MNGKILTYLKLISVTVLIGIVGGIIGSLFSHSISFVTLLREKYSLILYFMPVAGLVIAWLYRHFAKGTNGTETVLNAVGNGSKVPLSLGINIFTSTVLTHLVGGSAGREGAALQIGGSIGSALSDLTETDQKHTSVSILCGMSSVFSALFGTPLTAAVFVSEVSSAKFLQIKSLVPCLISSFTAFFVAKITGVHPERFTLSDIPSFSVKSFLYVILLAVLCSALSYVFCFTFRLFEWSFEKLLKNEYARIIAASIILIIFTFFFGRDYCGGSMWIIEDSLLGNIPIGAFILKLFLTTVTLSGGFKGGEIVPTLCIGSSFGCLFGMLFGFSPSLCAACGMISLFSGITNCPLAALLLSLELLSGAGFFYTVPAALITFCLARYCGLFKNKSLTLPLRHIKK